MRLVLIFALVACSVVAFAQDEATQPEKPFSNYVGIQVNQLLRQLVNFGGSNPITNPYLIAWAANHKQSGWGFSAGFGYIYSQVKSGDAISQTNTTINDFHLRFGPEKKSTVGKRWMIGFGGDLVVDGERNKTIANAQGSSTVITETNTSKFGLGPRFTINYSFSDRLMLGTEGSYYFRTITEKRKFSGIQSAQPITSNLKAFTPTLPAVIYFIVKF